jgi:hypothetical protein
MVNLTNKFVASVKPPRDKKYIRLWDSNISGFGLRVTDKGVKVVAVCDDLRHWRRSDIWNSFRSYVIYSATRAMIRNVALARAIRSSSAKI